MVELYAKFKSLYFQTDDACMLASWWWLEQIVFWFETGLFSFF